MSSVGLIVFFLLVAWISWVSEKSLYFLFVLAMILVSAFLLVALFFLVIYPTMRYEVRGDVLRLVCGPFNWSIPYSEIREITKANLKYHPSSTGWKLPGYAIGKVYYKDRGDVRMCATSMRKKVTLIKKTDGSLYGVTPRDEREFVDSLRNKM
ncbi:MAG: PH domain-containing protein [Candidatus Zixiibacteriota bacterium]|nr:MAG: PH domain-containing protein [candidate division Zixibacteria bacterium]